MSEATEGEGRRPRRKRPRTVFPPCSKCGADSGFTWRCECGFAICSECMNGDMSLVKGNGRIWSCPQCFKEHIGPNR